MEGEQFIAMTPRLCVAIFVIGELNSAEQEQLLKKMKNTNMINFAQILKAKSVRTGYINFQHKRHI
jgi:hypothetical protein